MLMEMNANVISLACPIIAIPIPPVLTKMLSIKISMETAVLVKALKCMRKVKSKLAHGFINMQGHFNRMRCALLEPGFVMIK